MGDVTAFISIAGRARDVAANVATSTARVRLSIVHPQRSTAMQGEQRHVGACLADVVTAVAAGRVGEPTAALALICLQPLDPTYNAGVLPGHTSLTQSVHDHGSGMVG